MNGYAMVGEKFGTATFEKDGSVDLILAKGRIYSGGKGRATIVDDNTFYHSISDGKTFEYLVTESFSNAARTRLVGTGQYFILSDSLPYSENPLAESFTYDLHQVSGDTFKEELAAAYASNNVTTADQPPISIDGNCAADDSDGFSCPSEELFRKTDPLYNSSPYNQDPSVKGGWIAFFVLLGVVLLVGILYVVHIQRLNAQTDRYKHEFARRIAETSVTVDPDMKLSAKVLEEEFKRIDIDGNGVITKSELQLFMGNRVAEKDFNVMFSAIDTDHGGTIDFAEFCVFMGQISTMLSKETDHRVQPVQPFPSAEKTMDEPERIDEEVGDVKESSL